ncbi:hypothetical protein [Methanogenium sp. MK-MG]|uniref:hypothetical protein n=1 Tax=Methanogenium sp. MK-MG TaxID=2599926 RepID=UPI0013EC2EE6|nr:hypothetical protein [Methanogenium sp. MK-MG]KAF1078453.1 hypothetical protein MKMG_00604 [Methanogenium sp. MK-MG]
MTDKHPAFYSAIIGIIAGVIITGLISLFSKGWWDLISYNQNLMGIEIVHMLISLLLVLFVAGCCIPFMLHTDSRRTILLHAAMTGLIAAAVARVLPFIGNPAYIISSLLSTVPQLLIILACGVLAATFGALFASFIGKDEEQGFAPLLPVAIVTVAVIVLPLLLAAGGVSTGIIPPAPYSCGPSEQPTDLSVIKLSPGDNLEWKTTVDISTYDGADTLTEYADGYAIATTEYRQESGLVHLILFDREGNYSRQPEVRTGLGQVSAIVPAPNDGFILATGRPGILRIDHKGETIWTNSLGYESHSVPPVSLLARADGSFVAAWANQTACLTDNNTVLWNTPLNTSSGPEEIFLSPADADGILVCTAGKHIFTGEHFEIPLKAIRLDTDGTILWEQTIATGIGDTLLGVWQNPPGHTIIYRTTTSGTDLWGKFVHTYTLHLITLDDAGTVTGLYEVEDIGRDVIPSPVRGYLSVDIGEESIAVTGYELGQKAWENEYDLQARPYSLKGIGTTDGGYLIAFSSPR